MFKFKKGRHHPDYFLLGLFFLLTVFGIIMLTSASSDLGKIKFDDSYYYLKHQMLYGLFLGLVGFFAAYFIPYMSLRKLALPLLTLNIGLLLLVFTRFGVAAGGASRWLRFGSLTFQPAELLKISFILYVAAWLSNPKTSRLKSGWKTYVPLLVSAIAISVLLVLQPATSTVAILMLAALTVFFMHGAEWKHLAVLLGGGALTLAILVYFTPYRFERVTNFFKKTDEFGSNYHLNQALIAIGSGRLTGAGFGQSSAKVTYLPAVIDDSIFAVIAQELGFIGAGGLVMLFLMLTLRMFFLGLKMKDHFGRLLLVGFAMIIGLQSLVNIGAISGVLPLTGVPLPFISYGGTALAVFLTMAGIALNVTKYN